MRKITLQLIAALCIAPVSGDVLILPKASFVMGVGKEVSYSAEFELDFNLLGFIESDKDVYAGTGLVMAYRWNLNRDMIVLASTRRPILEGVLISRE